MLSLALNGTQTYNFKAKFIKGLPDECWEWCYAKNAAGYGIVHIGGRTGGCQLAHRVSYWMHNGPFDLSKDLMHSCDNPGCVNPKHLSVATNAMNMADRIAKGRAKVSQRKRDDLKLNIEQAREIKKLLKEGDLSKRAIGRLFDVSLGTVRFIESGRLWAEV